MTAPDTPSTTNTPPAMSGPHTGPSSSRSVTRTGPAATLVVAVDVDVLEGSVVDVDEVAPPAAVVDVEVSGAADPVAAVVVGSEVAVVVEVSGGCDGQVAAGSELTRGGGSFGLPVPAGWKRQPSTLVGSSWELAGPMFEYTHPPSAVPRQ